MVGAGIRGPRPPATSSPRSLATASSLKRLPPDGHPLHFTKAAWLNTTDGRGMPRFLRCRFIDHAPLLPLVARDALRDLKPATPPERQSAAAPTSSSD